ncbi:unnamed protein product [Meloidogyne enterolobii]|uniref:Uncharacterized protein n=1 Tax=Meloidogyne enterolobii TaxID=390850 RepID=A0ACB1ASG3_MELEN
MSSSPTNQQQQQSSSPTPPPPPPPPTTADTQQNNLLIAPSTSSSLNTENNIKEYNILLIGIKRIRQILFDQLKQSAQKYEQHNHYTDISYLTFEFKQGEFSTLELMQIDPRTTRTGAHLMAIRKAHAAIICYAAHIPSSFHVLTGFSEDFNTSQSAEEKGGKGKGKIAKNTARPSASLLLCDNDVLIEEDEDKNEKIGEEIEEERDLNKPLISKLNLNGNLNENEEESEENIQESPKINTNNNQSTPRLRRPSMEKMVKELDDGRDEDWLITREKGEQLATMFGPDCQFKCFSFSALKAEQEAVEAEGLNDNTFIVTIIDRLIKRAEDVKSGKSTKNNTNNSTNNHLRRRSNSPTNLNSRRLSPLSTNLKRMLQGGTNHLKGGGNAVVKLITKKKNNNTNEENNTTNNAATNTNVENKKTSLGGMRRLFSRQKSEERNIPVKSGSTLSLPNSQQQQETQQQQPTENGKSNPPQSTSTSIFGNAYRAIITNPRERLKQRNNKIASTVPLAGNDVDNTTTTIVQQLPRKSLAAISTTKNSNFDIVQIQPPTGEINGEPFNFNNEENQDEEEEEEQKEENKVIEQKNDEEKIEKEEEENQQIQQQQTTSLQEPPPPTKINRFKKFAKQSSTACIIQ